jgi:NADH dehydrogenase/NADH:ubiquinone oxidoreductase subunit G
MVTLFVNDTEIEVKEGTTLLQACLDNSIYVPNLCYLKGKDEPSASCRMCFVEIEGEDSPVTSCTVLVKEDMVVKTDTPAVRQLQRSGLELLLSVHHVDCKNCPANKQCGLQDIAKFLKVGLKPKRLEKYLKAPDIDQSHPFLDYYPNRCILCGKCVHVCRTQAGRSILTFAQRGFDTVISFYGETETLSPDCDQCSGCVKICPVGALILKERQDGQGTKVPKSVSG